MRRSMLMLLKLGLFTGVSVSLVLFFVLNRDSDQSKATLLKAAGQNFKEQNSDNQQHEHQQPNRVQHEHEGNVYTLEGDDLGHHEEKREIADLGHDSGVSGAEQEAQPEVPHGPANHNQDVSGHTDQHLKLPNQPQEESHNGANQQATQGQNKQGNTKPEVIAAGGLKDTPPETDQLKGEGGTKDKKIRTDHDQKLDNNKPIDNEDVQGLEGGTDLHGAGEILEQVDRGKQGGSDHADNHGNHPNINEHTGHVHDVNRLNNNIKPDGVADSHVHEDQAKYEKRETKGVQDQEQKQHQTKKEEKTQQSEGQTIKQPEQKHGGEDSIKQHQNMQTKVKEQQHEQKQIGQGVQHQEKDPNLKFQKKADPVHGEKHENVKTSHEKNKQQLSNNAQEKSLNKDSETETQTVKETMHLAVVACGDRLEETLVMIKSAVLLHTPERNQLHCHIFADAELQPQFQQKLELWPEDVRQKFQYSIYPLSFPKDRFEEWKKLFKPCASQRLFLPKVLPNVDKLLYVDTDILFLRPMEDIWQFFKQFNSTHVAALSPEHEDRHVSWYARFARHPFYPPLGVNSGVMLMHLDRLREVEFLDHIFEYYKEYHLRITWGDQDLINIFFHYFPEKLLVYPCQWNYRPDHCMYMPQCKGADEQGISILHGNRGVFHNEKQPVFKAVYRGIKDHGFDENLYKLPKRIKNHIQEIKMEEVKYPGCFRVADTFTKQLVRQIHLIKEGKSNR